MKISNKISDKERHFLNTLIVSKRGEIPDKNGKVSDSAEYMLIIKDGFITEAVYIIKK